MKADVLCSGWDASTLCQVDKRTNQHREVAWLWLLCRPHSFYFQSHSLYLCWLKFQGTQSHICISQSRLIISNPLLQPMGSKKHGAETSYVHPYLLSPLYPVPSSNLCLVRQDYAETNVLVFIPSPGSSGKSILV